MLVINFTPAYSDGMLFALAAVILSLDENSELSVESSVRKPSLSLRISRFLPGLNNKSGFRLFSAVTTASVPLVF
ncbi:MAG: hypothetical protein J1E60_07125 [Christensenellaceae bacterium]|nr:hypothetical protein [Christensenellaceae bacterium]